MLEKRFIVLAESIRAEVRYDMNFTVSVNEFYFLAFQRKMAEQAFLNFNIHR